MPERCSRLAAASSAEVAPTTASTTRMMASAVRMATVACSATSICRPLASGSHPPVSCTMVWRPTHWASDHTLSRVTPGTSCTDRFATARITVHQSRFADIGPPDDGHHRGRAGVLLEIGFEALRADLPITFVEPHTVVVTH
ncbi:hypothetical protein MAUB1S_00958 [Mycolicibacterium aubagnense]